MSRNQEKAISVEKPKGASRNEQHLPFPEKIVGYLYKQNRGVSRSPQSPEPQTSAKNTENGTRNQHDARSRRSNRTHRLPRNPHGAARSTGAVAWRGEIAATVHCCHRQERKGKRTTISGGCLGLW